VARVGREVHKQTTAKQGKYPSEQNKNPETETKAEAGISTANKVCSFRISHLYHHPLLHHPLSTLPTSLPLPFFTYGQGKRNEMNESITKLVYLLS